MLGVYFTGTTRFDCFIHRAWSRVLVFYMILFLILPAGVRLVKFTYTVFDRKTRRQETFFLVFIFPRSVLLLVRTVKTHHLPFAIPSPLDLWRQITAACEERILSARHAISHACASIDQWLNRCTLAIRLSSSASYHENLTARDTSFWSLGFKVSRLSLDSSQLEATDILFRRFCSLHPPDASSWPSTSTGRR